MVQSAAIELSRAEAPIAAPITKFGGQPCWLEKAQWPISRLHGVPMEFIGQVALADVPSLPEDLRNSRRVAYIFMTGSEAGDEQPSTWESESGENAVILQPGGGAAIVETEEISVEDTDLLPECIVRMTLREEPTATDTDPDKPGFTIGPGTDLDIYSSMSVNKLGGTPAFIQAEEYPEIGGPWRFILQLHDYNQLADGTIFGANFGTGQAYVFVSADGREGRMLWQC